MIVALWIFGIVFALAALFAVAIGSGLRGNSDDFGAGFAFILWLAIAIVSGVIWLILAAFHWWPG